MKSKKLFAILTLVAFMMTLVPAMAFGGAAVRFASDVQIDTKTVDATGEDFAKITVYLSDAANNEADNQDVYIASNRKGCDIFYNDDEAINGNKLVEAIAGSNVYKIMTVGGEADIYVASQIGGAAKIAVGLVAPEDPATGDATKSIYNYLMDVKDATAESVGLINDEVLDVTFVASGLDKVASNKVESKTGDIFTATGTPNLDNVSGMDANGSDWYEISFKVQNEAKVGLNGEDVTFSINKSGARLNKTKATTDVRGVVKVKIYADKSDTYTVKAACGSKSGKQDVIFGAGNAFNIELVDDNNQKIALAQTDKEFEVKIADLRGNEIEFADGDKGKDLISTLGLMEDPEVITEPTGSDIEGSIKLLINDDKKPIVKIPKFKKEGDYVVRATLTNGKYVDIKFTVKEQGDIVALSLEYDEKSLTLEGVSSAPTVKRLDDDGISLEVASADFANDLDFFSSDLDKAKVADTGKVTAGDDSDYLGDVTISVVDKDEKKTASTVITICDYARALIFEAPKATVPSETAKVTVKAVDKKGNVVSLGDDATITAEAWVISAPTGSSNSADFDNNEEKDFKQKGTGILEVDCDKDGTVKVQVKVKATYADTDKNATLSGIVEVPFSKNAAPIDAVGANSLTMFIGNTAYVQDGVAKVTDVAPFIKDSRTFVAIRPVADAFGCEIGWNEATQTVTLTRTDITVTIVIGSKDITVTRNGVVETVTADVAAFIQNGRTVLPFRAIGNIFGATVNYDAATQSVSYAQQAQK